MLHRPIIALFTLVLVLGGCASSNYGAGTAADRVEILGDRVYFGTDSSIIPRSAYEILDSHIAWLVNYETVRLTIEGHADERGTREYNLALGNRRAAAVRNYMMAKGIAPDRINMISYGKERPEVAGTDELSLAKNRRALSIVQ